MGIPSHAPILWCTKPHYPIPYLAIDKAIYHVKIGGTLQKPPTFDLASSEPQLRLVKICHQFCVELDAFKEPNILLILAIATFLSAEDIIMEPSCCLTTCDYNGEI